MNQPGKETANSYTIKDLWKDVR